jgi:hypothetical protein
MAMLLAASYPKRRNRDGAGQETTWKKRSITYLIFCSAGFFRIQLSDRITHSFQYIFSRRFEVLITMHTENIV